MIHHKLEVESIRFVISNDDWLLKPIINNMCGAQSRGLL